MLDDKSNMEGSFFMSYRKFTYEQKLEAVLNITDKHMSINAAAKLLGCGHTPLSRWLRLFQEQGAKGLIINRQTYTGDFKLDAVQYMHKNHLSASMAAPALGMPKPDYLLKWERIYYQEGPQALKEEHRGRTKNMNSKKREQPPKQLKPEVQEDLIAEVQRLRMENEYLKKINALVQERIQLENGKK